MAGGPIASGLASMGKSIIGATDKAILVIHTNTADTVNSASVSDTTAGKLNPAAMAKGALGAGGGSKVPPGPHVLHVQYNPSSITFQANAEPIPFRYLQQHMDSSVPNQSLRPPMVVLGVELVFDQMNTQDAFMAQKFDLSVGNVISDIGGAVVNLKRGGYTVQPETNALMAALLRHNTRTVTFRWADMAFTGQLFQAQAEYTMFSPSGKPIRSKVQLQIAQQVESTQDAAYWEKAIDTVFKGGLGGGKGVGQKLGNLLNTNGL